MPHGLTEHSEYEDQPETLQSTGQPKALQKVLDVVAAQLLPLKAADTTTERVLVLKPMPHVLVQALYEDQPETSQWTPQ